MTSDVDGLYWVSAPRATFGLLVRNGIVAESAPYGRKWCLGRVWIELETWLRYRGYDVRRVSRNAGTLDNVTGIE